MEVDLQGEDDVPDAENNLCLDDDDPLAHLGRATDRLIEGHHADVDVGPTVDSVKTQSNEKAAKAKKKRKRKGEKAKEAAVERPLVKKKKKERAQS